jgi:hypothetical protein
MYLANSCSTGDGALYYGTSLLIYFSLVGNIEACQVFGHPVGSIASLINAGI